MHLGVTSRAGSAFEPKHARRLVVWTFGVLLITGCLAVSVPKGADTLPDRLTDQAFWSLVSGFSEEGGYFPYENFLSNETSYQYVIPQLVKVTKAGGAYLGVAPEQNFTYIAAIRPKIAFIIDIRRQNMLELLVYKALFEISPDRADFVSHLFSRKRPERLDSTSSATELFSAYRSVPPDPQLFSQNLQTIKDRLIKEHRFLLSKEDEEAIAYVANAFFEFGPNLNYSSIGPSPVAGTSYQGLMTLTDLEGRNWSYLAAEDNYQRVRQMQQQNLIVPLVGDFGGTKALRAVAGYLKEHSAVVSAFYVSNVEMYLDRSAYSQFRSNVAALPLDDTSMFIQFTPSRTTLVRMQR